MVFSSCKVHFEIKKDCISELKNELKTNWKYSDEKGYFEISEDFKNKLNTVYKKCLMGLNQDSIITLFGKPSQTKQYKSERFKFSVDYAIMPPCKLNTSNETCIYYIFYFDENYKLVDMMTLGRIKTPIKE